MPADLPSNAQEARHDAWPMGLGFELMDDAWLVRVRKAIAEPGACRIGDYELIREIGRGGQGIVYQARQPSTGRVIALKRVATGALASEVSRQRFAREVRTAAALKHPHIVTVFGCDLVHDQGLLAMEYIEGRPVDRWAQSFGAPGNPQRTAATVALFEQLSRAVAHAHQHGVIHRDLKPSNVLVDAAGEPHVLDFGLARLLSPYVGDSLFETHTTGFVGTPAYASPEHFHGADNAVDVRSDVYSVAVMLYQALSGKLPYRGEMQFSALMSAIQESEPVRLTSAVQGVPRELELIVLKALSKDKSQRYQSMDAFGDDLRRFQLGETVTAHPPTAWYQARKLIRRHRLAFGAGLVIATLLVALATTATILGLRERDARRDAEASAYQSCIAAASAALRAGDAASAKSDLLRAPQALRGWEWNYFNGQADQSRKTRNRCEGVYAVDEDGNPLFLKETKSGLAWSEDREKFHFLMHAPAGTGSRTIHGTFSLFARPVPNPATRDAHLWELVALDNGRSLAHWTVLANSIHVSLAPDNRNLIMTDSAGLLSVLRLPPIEQAVLERTAIGESPAHELTEADFRRISLRDSRIIGLEFSSDGRRLATCGGNGLVKIVNLDSLAVTQTLNTGERSARALAFSPDGRTLAVGSIDERVSLWDLSTGTALWFSTGHTEMIEDVTFSPDGARIASASFDKTIRVWESSTGACLAHLRGHPAPIDTLVFLGNADRLASIDHAGVLKTWHLSELQPPIAFGQYRRIHAVVAPYTNAGWMVVSESPDDSWRGPRISLIDLRSRRKNGVLWTDDWMDARGMGAACCTLEASRDGRWLAAGCGNGEILLWRGDDVADWQNNGDSQAPVPVRQLKAPTRSGIEDIHVPDFEGNVPPNFALSLSFDSGNRRLAVGRADGALDVWDPDRGEVVLQRPAPASPAVCYCNFSPDGSRLAVQLGSGVLQVLRANNATPLCERSVCKPESVRNRPEFSPDGTLIAALNDSNEIVLLRTDDLETVITMKGHAGIVHAVVFSPDARRLVTAGSDHKLKVWDTLTGRELATLHGHELDAACVRFLSEETVVSGGWDNSVRFWDAPPPVKTK